jgi:hypothetical protein
MSIYEIKQLMYFDTPHGEGIALFIMDYGPQANTIWIVANCTDGKIRHYSSSDISLTTNFTLKVAVKKP